MVCLLQLRKIISLLALLDLSVSFDSTHTILDNRNYLKHLVHLLYFLCLTVLMPIVTQLLSNFKKMLLALNKINLELATKL